MIDTHSHINFDEYKKNFSDFIEEIKSNEVEKVIIPGVEPSKFDEIISYCEKYEMIYGAVGIHPSEFQTFGKETEKKILELSAHPKIVAIGEIGLDYYYGAESKLKQQNIFRKQLEMAQDLTLPVIVHDREAHTDTFNIVNEYKLKNVIFHCFSGGPSFALDCIEKGYYISIGGIVTFKNAKDLKETVKIIPLEYILLETDAPYLAPVPFRGKINTPAYLKYIAKEIADIKNIDIQQVKKQTTLNAQRIFNF